MIITINLSISTLEKRCFKVAQRFNYWPRLFEKYVYLTLIKGGQEKENHSQQIPTFRCSEWSNFKDLHCKDLHLSPHRGYVAIIDLTSS